ncbi:hypothetical protein [Hoylesella buccalis]|uniref:Uncharacterized protein n=1 Tax=Hoylesella buccalis DNF00853 TaxID=1401074 RepID=A0A095ZEW9_9BACT|nr:hypothetical protein [Hoylesella buccalis]KGF32911.1 hypothetical protein HMPREF2137_12270 [Hoylesella buccalis DNF00853]
MMSKVNISIMLSVVAFAVSLVCAMLYSMPVNSVGVIISALSVLVTVLIGWNIYSAVDFNKKSDILRDEIKQLDKHKAEVADMIKATQENLQCKWTVDIMEGVPLMIATQLDDNLEHTLAECVRVYKKNIEGSVFAKSVALNYITGISCILYQKGREHDITVRHLAEDLSASVSVEDVQLLWNDIFQCKPLRHEYPLALLNDLLRYLIKLKHSDNSPPQD